MDKISEQKKKEQIIFTKPQNITAQPDIDHFDLEEEPSFFSRNKIKIVIGVIMFLIIVASFYVFFILRMQTKSSKVNLTYWGIWEDESVFAQVLSDFNRQFPNITIKYEKRDIKSEGKYIERLRTRINNGTGPDVFRFHNSWIIQMKDLLLPFPENVVVETELDKKFYDVVKEDLNINGAYYGIPLGIDTLALFINNEIFKAAGAETPITWDDLAKLSSELTVKEQETGKIVTSGVALGTYDNIAHAGDIISLLFIVNGADLKKLAGTTRKNSEQALDFYTFFAKGEDRVWDQSLENSKLSFAKGKLAMYFGYSWDVFEIRGAAPNLDFSIVPVPKIAGGKNATIASYWAEGISIKTKYQKEAFEFIKFVSKRETLEKLYSEASKQRGFGYPYPRVDMIDLMKDNPIVFPFVDQAKYARSTIFSSDTHDDNLIDSLNQVLGNAVRSVLLNTSTESAIETLSKEVERYLGQYEK